MVSNATKSFGFKNIRHVVKNEEALEVAKAKFKASGFRLSEIKSSRKYRAALADALTAAEDFLEIQRPNFNRESIRALRRELERMS